MKRVYCLYRVSTEQQVEKHDIPMQREACHSFAEERGWSIEKEYYEKGVSGFKVSAEKRDAIQQIKSAAVRREFDILLVFMFDRLGRRDDETPFVVEWFVRNGIAVWSVKEGEQRFDNHIDKLLNYIQFWQASGESIKTSIRTRTRIEQLTREGYYTGGAVPYGYHLVHRGRKNRQGHEVYDLVVDPQKADVVRTIYHKYVFEGMGTYRIAGYLTAQGVSSSQEDHWHAHSISYILQNPVYTGLLRKGAAQSDRLKELQIISDDLFRRAQRQRLAYKEAEKYRRRHYQGGHEPMTLLGLAYCGYCGKRLIRGTGCRKRVRKDGEVTYTLRQRYICSTRQSHKERCGGPAGYGPNTLEETVIELITQMLWDMQDTVWVSAYTAHEAAEAERIIQEVSEAQQRLRLIELDLGDLNQEVIKSLRSESEVSIVILQGTIEHTNKKIKEEKRRLAELEKKLTAAQWRKEHFLKICAQSEILLEALHSEEAQAVMEVLYGLVERIDVRGTKDVSITYIFSSTNKNEIHGDALSSDNIGFVQLT